MVLITETSFADIKCGVPQGSILGLLSFLIYANDLNQPSDILDPIMFADDTNPFYSHKDIKMLFHTVNTELVQVTHWFKANKLSLSAKKTIYTLFHKPSTKDDIPLKIPELVIDTKLIKQKIYIKFLGVMIDECITWKEHIRTVEIKLQKILDYYIVPSSYLIQVSLKVFIFHIFMHIITTQMLHGEVHKKPN